MLAVHRRKRTGTALALSTAVALTAGCGAPLKIPETAQIRCQSNNDCAPGYVCITTTGLCAVAANVDHTPPELQGTVSPTPTTGRDGTAIEVRFTVTKPLSVDPEVVAQLGSGTDTTATATFVKQETSSGNDYVYRWVAHSGDPEGTATISINMVDRVGNPGSGSGGAFVLDFSPPKVVTDSTSFSLGHAKAADTQTISFVTNEAAATVTVDVGAEMAVQAGATGNQYTFTYVVPANATEGTTEVVAHLTDAAGNSAEVTLGSFIIDRTAPAFTGTSDVTAGPLRAGDDVRVKLDFNEPVGNGVGDIGVTLTSGSTSVEMLRAAGSTGVSSHWEFLHTVKPGEDGSWSARIHDATDAAGNTLSTTTLTGAITVDTTAPTTSLPSVPNAPLKNGDTLSVSFTTSETLSADPVVTIGGQALARASASAPPAYVFTRTVDKTVEHEGGAPVVVELADAAGNRGSATLGTVVYDFTPPGIVSGSSALTLTPPSGSLVRAVSAVTTGTGAVVSFTANEVLSSAPVVTAKSGATTLSFSVTGHPTTAYVATLGALPATPVQGQYAVTAHMVDTAGNAVDVPINLTPNMAVDTTTPAALTATTQALVTYQRNPWGTSGSSGRPEFKLVGLAGAVEAGNTIVAFDSSDAAHRTELGRQVAPSGDAGAFSMELQQSDNEVVYLVSVDAAGNASPAADVKNVRWTATLNAKVFGDTIANPHAIFSGSSLALPRPGIDALVEAADEARAGSPDDDAAFAAAGWSQISTNGETAYRAPNARKFGTMVYDEARGRIVLFGGINTNGNVLGDTWEWDGRGWQSIVPPHSPPARVGHAMAYDAAHRQVVIFGGQTLAAPEPGSAAILSDTWVWNGADWREVTPANHPAARVQHAMTYDSVRKEVVLFGGLVDPKYKTTQCPGASSEACEDTWVFDGSEWTEKHPSNPPPGAYQGAMAFDAARSVAVFFGGTAPNDLLTMKVWEWDGTDWSSTETDLIPPVGGTMTWDPDRGRTLQYGGNSLGQYYEVVWEWDGTKFSNLFPTTAPTSRRHHAAAYDPQRKQFVIFSGGDGGLNSTLTERTLSDTWEWDGSEWMQRTPTIPPIALQVHSVAFDSARGRLVMQGDYESAGQWEFDGTNWRKTFSQVETGLRYFPALAFNSIAARLLLFGGLQVGTGFFQGTSQPMDDTWYLGGEHWSDTGFSGPPAGYPAPAMVFDSARGEHVLVIRPRNDESGDVQTWIGGVTGWVEADPQHKPTIGTCRDIESRLCGVGKVAYDPIRHVTVYVNDDGSNLQTWEWNGTDWADKTPSTSPPMRQWEALAWDAARGRTQLFGGIGEQDQDLTDTWEWDGSSWTERKQAHSPPGRYYGEMASDTWRSRITMYGGASHTPGSCGTVGLGVCSDTWTLNTPEERGSLVVQFDARRAAQPTSVDPVARTITGAKLVAIASGAATPGVRSVQVNRPGAPETIPDSTKPAGLTQKLHQPRACQITSAEVSLRMTHYVPEGLSVTLKSPAGTSVRLFEGNATQETQSTRFPGVTAPVDALTALNGEQGQGYWTLTVTNSELDTEGTLDGWGLDLKCTEPTTVSGAELFAWDPAGGPWDPISAGSGRVQELSFDRTWTSATGTTIDDWNNRGFYRFAVAPKGAAGAGAGSAELDYAEFTLSYRRQ